MAEHEHPSDSLPADRAWDVEAISRALSDLPQERTDLAFGAGVRFRLGQQQETELELFPAAGVVRVTSADMQLALLGLVESPTVAASGLIFTRRAPSHCSLAISPEGTMTFVATPAGQHQQREGSQMAAAAAAASQRLAGQFAAEAGPTDDSVTFEDPSPRPPPESRREGQPRVVFAGRLGKDPRCRTTPREILVCSFPVAEKHEGDEKPTWRTVVTFKEVARTVQETLRRGMFAEFVTYEHQKARRIRDGQVRMETEYYATAVIPR